VTSLRIPPPVEDFWQLAAPSISTARRLATDTLRQPLLLIFLLEGIVLVID
jgi:hypothetical protein